VADHDGWVRTRVPIEKSEHALAEMLRLGAEVEVLTPPELRRRIATVAAAMVRVYEAEPRGICAPVPDGPALACDRSAP
jgi:predicted DNA-binding transcriptional regulator YafY